MLKTFVIMPSDNTGSTVRLYHGRIFSWSRGTRSSPSITLAEGSRSLVGEREFHFGWVLETPLPLRLPRRGWIAQTDDSQEKSVKPGTFAHATPV